MVSLKLRRGIKPSPWPKFFTAELTALFTGMGWTADNWFDIDREAAFRDGPVALRFRANLGPREQRTLREWLREPPEMVVVPVVPISPAVALEALTRHGYLAPNVLNAYAAGASERFVETFLTSRETWFRHNFPDGRPDVAWDNARRAGLSETEAVGWALTGRLVDVPGLAGQLDDDLAVRLILPWADLCGPGAYLWVLAGFSIDEASALVASDARVGDEQLRVMIALAGVVLPAGV